MQIMNYEPYNFTMKYNEYDKNKFYDFKHRTLKYEDLINIIKNLKYIYKKYKKLSNLFFVIDKEINTVNAIIRFNNFFFKQDKNNYRLKRHITSPINNSACKRMNLFLRWMVRKNNPDLGLWTHIPVNKLLCSLDVHSTKTAIKLKLITKKP